MSAMKYWIWLASLPGLGLGAATRLLEYFQSPKEIYFATEAACRAAGITGQKELTALKNKHMDRPSRIWRDCEELGFRILTRQDSEYPVRLLNIYDAPLLLYVKGRLPAVDETPIIAMVGTRKCTPYGARVAEQLAYEVTKQGGTVVTGLAEGVDGAAALGALRAGGRPLGVLGTGLDICFPARNRQLHEDVAAAGALISEYPPGTPGLPGNFPRRNRIISGLSVGVTVIEAPNGSGALITASRALDQDRELFVVPGNIDSPACRGSNGLLWDGNALPVTCGWDILREFEARFPDKLGQIRKGDFRRLDDCMAAELAQKVGVEPTEVSAPKAQKPEKAKPKEQVPPPPDLRAQLEALSADELSVVSVMTEKEMHLDDIIDLSGRPAGAVVAALMKLELKGYTVAGKGKRYTLLVSQDDKK